MRAWQMAAGTRLVALGLTLAQAFAAPPRLAEPAKDPVLRAMEDELARVRMLQIVSLDKVYYADFALQDVSLYSTGASLGALYSPVRLNLRVPRVNLRLGGYNLDNTNFILSGIFGERREEVWPLDDDYNVLRQGWWLATDRAYKAAARVIARKRAALAAITQTEKLNDFAHAEPLRYTPALTARTAVEGDWPERVRRLSAVFLDYPQIANSDVSYGSTAAIVRYVNTEGSLQRYSDDLDHVRISALAYAPDGSALRSSWTIVRTNHAPMPGQAELLATTERIAGDLRGLVAAATGDDYSGPVLFETTAAAQMFAQLLGSNLALTRIPITDPGRTLPLPGSELEGRIGSSILPAWMDVTDDPALEFYGNQPAAGHYVVDIEGVAAKPVSLVEKGILKNYLMTRQPVRGFEGSNGHARLPGMFGASAARISNLVIKASTTVSEAALKQKLIDLCKQRGKPYGILVRRLDFPTSASAQEIRAMATAAVHKGGSSRIFSAPLTAYKVYPDGREELVRGLRFRGLPVRSLKDLVAASDRPAIFSYMDNGAILAMAGAGSTVTACSVISPSVLLDDVDMERAREEIATPALVPPPPLAAP
ncbi:MAG: hypothetical protein IT160_13180 [Bryobacterales bacterium]|nr:hypothetical protein [Bryobacterales bacterium]